MAQMDPDLLSSLVTRYLARKGNALSPAERTEALRIAQGIPCKVSAQTAGISYETIRARRKRLYRKLGVSGSTELVSSLLLVSLDSLARGQPLEVVRSGVAPPAVVPAAAAAEPLDRTTAP
jgi:DNA-binding CsgD family transcriptional regulator